MRLCANLTWLFGELPMLERFAAAKEAGFMGVEILDPYDMNVQEVVQELALHGLAMVLINAPPPNYTGGDRGWAAVPGARFQGDFRRAARYAKALGAQHMHIMAGVAQGNSARATFVENLRWASAHAPGQRLTIEPLNTADQPGYFLADYDQAVAILTEVGAPNLGLQFDTYHAHRIHGDALAVWADVRQHVTHVQIAQAPDRTEPIGGPIDFESFFAALQADGYTGWVSAEYGPVLTTKAGLGWMKEFASP